MFTIYHIRDDKSPLTGIDSFIFALSDVFLCTGGYSHFSASGRNAFGALVRFGAQETRRQSQRRDQVVHPLLAGSIRQRMVMHGCLFLCRLASSQELRVIGVTLFLYESFWR